MFKTSKYSGWPTHSNKTSETSGLASAKSFPKMDLEVQQLKERDLKLKNRIRRFRFALRSLHLMCSIVMISLLAANFAGKNAFEGC